MTAEQVELINVGLALFWLGGAILFARARGPKEAYQMRRVPLAAAVFAAGGALIDIAVAMLSGQLDIIWFHVILGIAILFGMIAFLSTLFVDVFAIMLGATRTPPWLVAGIAAAILFFYAWLFLVGGALWGVVPGAGSVAFFVPGLLAAAAGLIWWSELPRRESGEAGIFD